MGDEQGQGVNLAENCIRNGTVAHEIGHLIGFWHEHTRPDRDRFVEILKRNVLTGRFNKFFSFLLHFHIRYNMSSMLLSCNKTLKTSLLSNVVQSVTKISSASVHAFS